jgi:vancomycin permeability regulator SanA
VIVTQKYHLYRAIYIAEDLGIEAAGVSADLEKYAGQLYRDIREILARIKDFGLCILN